MSPADSTDGNYLGCFEPTVKSSLPIVLDDAACVRVLNRVIEWQAYLSSRPAIRLPNIMTWEKFLSEVHYRSVLKGEDNDKAAFVLSSRQEYAVWQSIVREKTSLDWPSSAQVAKILRASWRTQNMWNFDLLEPGKNTSLVWEDYRTLVISYHSRLKDLGAIDSFQLLRTSLENPQTDKILAHGIFSPAPVLRSWIKKKAKNLSVLKGKSEVRRYHKYANKTAEMESALDWAKKVSEANPISKIAVVVDLGPSEETIVQSLCREIFSRDVYFSSSPSLLEQPFVRLGMALLELKDVPRWDDLSLIINHPLLHGSVEEGSERALLDFELRSEGRYEWPLRAVIQRLLSSNRCPVLMAYLTEICKNNETLIKRDSIVNWISFFRKRLKSLRWLEGEQNYLIDSRLLGEWASACDRVSDLDAVLGRLSYPEAIWHLKNALANQSLRYAGSPCNVFVVNSREALTINPTHIWVTDCVTDKPSIPNETTGLLSFEKQRLSGVPGSNPATDYRLRQNLLSLLFSGRKEFNASFAQEERDIERLPSSFFPELSIVPLSIARSNFPYGRRKRLVVSYYSDELGPKPDPDRFVRGGVSILEAQAACPFKAFSKYRLQSTSLEDVTPGISRKIRGIAVHKALAFVWQKFRTQSQLIGFEQLEIPLIARLAIESSRLKLSNITPTELACRSVEESRVLRLLLAWLESEKKDEEFVVSSIEEQQKAEIAGLKISCRIDRVDTLPDGSKRIIDYKTGRCSLADLAPPRIDSPQLLIYANQSSLGAITKIALGKVDVVDPKLLQKELSEQDAQFPEWRTDLERLAEEVIGGLAIVSPKRSELTCMRCDQHLFCRIKSDDRITTSNDK